MTNTLNTQIERNTSHAITLQTTSDLSGWTLIYLAKNKATDEDADAVISITTQIIEVEDLKNIAIAFPPDITKDIAVGQYYQSCRAISANEQTVITLFNGCLKITQEGIKAPL